MTEMTKFTDGIEISPRSESAATSAVFLLHGVGSSAVGMAALANAIADELPHSHVVVPNGFEAFDMGTSGYQWFSVKGITETNRAARIAEVLPRLEVLLDRERKRLGLQANQTALVGFSQGAILSMHLAASSSTPPAAVEALAGRLASGPIMAGDGPRPPVFVSGGDQDGIISVTECANAAFKLRSIGCEVETEVIPGHGHSVHPKQVESLIQHLKRHLTA